MANPGSGIRKRAGIEATYGKSVEALLVELNEEGFTSREVCDLLGISSRTFGTWVKLAGFERWPRKTTAAMLANGARRARRIFVHGAWLTINEASRRYKLDRRTLWSRIVRGVKGDALVAPPDGTHRPKDCYHLDLSERDWAEVVAYAKQRGTDYVRRKLGIPLGAVNAAVNGEFHRLG
jgi:hypothetical protein